MAAREDRVRHRSRSRSPHHRRRSRTESVSSRSSYSRSRSRHGKKSHRHRERSRKNKKERKRRSYSSSGSSSSDSSSDSSPREKRHKKKKHHHKKSKKEKKSAPLGAVTEQYGKYGVIRTEDQYEKRAEFLTWLVEVKGVDIEALSHIEERKLFEDFVEDYNTATMPSKKYYDIPAWEARQAAKKAKHARKHGGNVSFDDERSRAQEIQTLRAARTDVVTKQTFDVMKKDSDLVRSMKEQEDARNAVKYLHKAGHHDAAEKIADKLRPGAQENDEDEN
ncbi:hypothetical protein FOL47_002366 [Perkinsus chesapeaki]|uniref:Uncharacterized protein n=1 Tax=Perkinsus chesapeaki TaxID=330153 RepID=A0A7J6MDX0_PERCH|nr:hypothetical protein FOL47_002366 [Perkinsus chesapeaki]